MYVSLDDNLYFRLILVSFYFYKNESYFCLCIVNIHIACEDDSYYFVNMLTSYKFLK